MLNILPITLDGGLHAGQTVTLDYHSVSSPSLTVDPGTNRLLLSWSVTSPVDRIQFAVSDFGTSWQTPVSTALDETITAAPSLLGVASGGLPPYVLSWTGTDVANPLNVRYTNGYPQWPLDDTKTILPETALGAPALGHLDGSTAMLVAWSGTDAAHHLNVAALAVALPAALHGGIERGVMARTRVCLEPHAALQSGDGGHLLTHGAPLFRLLDDVSRAQKPNASRVPGLGAPLSALLVTRAPVGRCTSTPG